MAPQQGRSDVAQVFIQLGYDVTEADDMIRLAADLRWVADRRRAQEAMRTQRVALLGSALIAIVGAGGTLLVQWLWTRLTGIKS